MDEAGIFERDCTLCFDSRQSPKENQIMAFITTIDVLGLTPTEYRAVLDKMGVETNPEPGLYLHLTARIDGGYRITEVWDSTENFDAFMKARLAPAAVAIGLQREMAITQEPLYNIFAPRLEEMPALVESAEGRPRH
ncbi:hypothetical protein ABH935_009864 [Catenulispora sp. GAS73]|uniref:hypothetical protein n=1 Tax=Catenulispora sp. GAS73 TaxID=3156269 RepID=UPI00351482E9